MGRPAIVPDLLRRRAAHAPDAVALAVGGGDPLTLSQWDERSNAAARGLAARGVRSGDRVALVFDNARWLELAVAYVAAHKAGAVAVPLAPRFPVLDLHRILAHCDPTAVVSPPDLTPGGGAWPGTTVAELEAGQPADPFQASVGAGGEAEVLYATGAMRPPGARVATHEELLARSWLAAPVGVLVHSFVVGTPAGQGALRLPLVEEDASAVVLAAFDPGRFWDVVETHRASSGGVTPSMARMLLERDPPDGRVRSSLRRLVLSDPPTWPGLADGLTRVLPEVAVAHVPSGEGFDAEADGAETAPLAAAQDGMVWHEQFAPGSFNLSPPVRRYRGPLDIGALQSALSEIVRRHAALRTRFTIAGGRGRQVFPAHRPLELPFVDLGALPAEERQPALARIVADARARPFDLVADPPFAPTLVRLDADDHVMVIRAHHSVYDDWSVGVFRRELSALYAAYLEGRPSPLPELPATVPEVVRRQARALEGETGETERSFWRRELEGAPLAVQLPIDDPGRPEGSPHRAPPPITVELPPELAGALREIARRRRATPFMVLLAAFSVLVARYTGQADLLLSTLVANRASVDLEGLIGCFGKKVLVRIRLGDDPPFGELVVRTRRALMGALAHQNLAYETVLQEMLGTDAAAHGLAAQVAIKFQAAITAREGLNLPGLTTTGVRLAGAAEPTAHFLAGEESGAAATATPPWGAGLYLGAFLGLSMAESEGSFRLVTEGVFHPPEVERLLAHFQILLADVAADPTRQVSMLRLVDDASRPDPLQAAPSGDLSGPSVHAAVEAQARRAPDRVAVTFGDDELTFAELEARAGHLAARLRGAGESPQTPVGLPVTSGIDLAVGVVGIWKAGGAIVAGEAGASLVVDEVGEGPTQLAYVSPEGVEIEHGSLVAVGAGLQAAVYPPGAAGLRVCVAAAPSRHAFVRGLLALAAGHTVHLMKETVGQDPGSYLSLLGQGQVDVLDCTATELVTLLDAGLQSCLDRRRPTGAPAPLLIVSSGTAMAPELWARWRGIVGARVHFLWGPPECSFGATTCPASGSPVRPGIGHALPGSRTLVLDPHGRSIPSRALGTLVVSGACVARGYRDQPDLTAGRFTADADPPSRMFRTGKLARRMPDDSTQLVGDPDDHVDLRGFRIEPSRIEAALAGCPEIADVAVVAGSEQATPRLVAYVVASPGAVAPTLVELRRWLWRTLPGYAWPAAMAEVDAIPRGENGSVDQSALPAPGPSVSRSEGPLGPSVPRSEGPLGPWLASAWAEVVGSERVGADANYWQSFAFIDVLAEACRSGMPVSSRTVTRNRTLEMLAVDMAAAAATPGQQVESN